MKGIVFNLLEEVVCAHHGAATWDGLVDAAGVTGAYTSLGSYRDEEIVALVGAASAALQVLPGEVLRWFGREAMPLLAKRFPAFFEAHDSLRPFITSLNSIIHPEVRKLYAGAACPHFHFEAAPDGALLIGYQSTRQLCDLAHGFIEGAARHYGEEVTIEHLNCMHQGHDRCLIRMGA
jgi:hypothetical protein